MISRLLLIGFCLVSFNVFGQSEDETQQKEAEKFAVVLTHSPMIGMNWLSTSIGCEYRFLLDPDKITQLGVMGGAQHVDFEFFGENEGFGFFTGSFFLLGRDHFLEINGGVIVYYDRSPYGTDIWTGGGYSDGFVGWSSWPLISLGYRYETSERVIFKTGISTVGIYSGLGLKF